jgi:CrcB protein
VLAIAAGAVIGAGLRWAVLSLWSTGPFPWPVLVVNVAGSLVLGALLAEEWAHPRARLLLHDFGGIGFCGSLTTFSTFSVAVVELLRDGDELVALASLVASVVGSIGGVVAGAAALHRVRAAGLPLEERP